MNASHAEETPQHGSPIGGTGSNRRWRTWPPLTLLLAALLLRVALMPVTAHLPNGLTDEGFWKHWMKIIHERGVLNIFRASETDYVGYHWVLWLMSEFWDLFGGSYSNSDTPLHIFVKVPSILFDFVLIFVVFRVVLNMYGASARASFLATAAAAVLAFQPAVLYDGAVWAQTDSAITAAMLASLYFAARNRSFAAGAALAIGMAIKPHPIVIGPTLAVLLWQSGGWFALRDAAAGWVLTFAAVLSPWLLYGEFFRIVDVYEVLFTQERGRLSELAWNFWWILDYRGDPRPGDSIGFGLPISFKLAGLVISGLSCLLAVGFGLLRPGLRGALLAAGYMAFAFYMWPIGSHERYLFPFLGLVLPVAVHEFKWIPLYAIASATFFLNLFVVAPPLRRWMDQWVYGEFGPWVAAVNLAVFVCFSAMLVFEAVTALSRRQAERRGVALASP